MALGGRPRSQRLRPVDRSCSPAGGAGLLFAGFRPAQMPLQARYAPTALTRSTGCGSVSCSLRAIAGFPSVAPIPSSLSGGFLGRSDGRLGASSRKTANQTSTPVANVRTVCGGGDPGSRSPGEMRWHCEPCFSMRKATCRRSRAQKSVSRQTGLRKKFPRTFQPRSGAPERVERGYSAAVLVAPSVPVGGNSDAM